MQAYYTTQTWGYRIVSPSKLSFYHVLLSSIPHLLLMEKTPEIMRVEKESDGSIRIELQKEVHIEHVIKKILAFFEAKSIEFFDTPRYYYKIPENLRQSLLSWSLAFEGCLALMLLEDTHTSTYFSGKWKYINAKTGGLYMSPFTVLLHTDYAKIVHPVTLGNYSARKDIEQTTANLIRKIFRRMEQAQKGLEGIALLSMVEEKTQLNQKSITEIINQKSFQISVPSHSSFFTTY